MREARRWAMVRIGYAETRRPISVASGGAAAPLRRFEAEWQRIHVVEIDQPLVERTALIAEEERLGALDALHLAAALSISPRGVVFATSDRELHAAAQRRGLEVLTSGF